MPKEEIPLYEDEQIIIDYLPTSIDDHFLNIKNQRGFVIPRGILEDLAKTKRGRIERKFVFNDQIPYVAKQEGISVDQLHIAFCQAYAEEQDRIYHTPLPSLDEE